MYKVVGAILILSVQFGDGRVTVTELKAIADQVNSMGTTWTAETEDLARRAEYSSGYTTREQSDGPELRNTEDSWSTRGCGGLCSGGGGTDDEYTEMMSKYFTANDPQPPPEFDARKEWPYCPIISHIYDQGLCGSCWAVSTVSAFADRICIKTKGQINVPRSSQQVISCCHRCGQGCDSTEINVPHTWFYLRGVGVVTGGDYNSNQGCQPYKMQPCAVHENAISKNQMLPLCSTLPVVKEPPCVTRCDNKAINFEKDKVRVKEVHQLMDERAVQVAIMKDGPVVYKMPLYEDFLAYKSGVYQHVSGKKVGAHVMRVIGWGTDENNQAYWLIANSFNTGWGDNGIGKLLKTNFMRSGSFYAGTVNL